MKVSKFIKRGLCILLSVSLFFLLPPVARADANDTEGDSTELMEEIGEASDTEEEDLEAHKAVTEVPDNKDQKKPTVTPVPSVTPKAKPTEAPAVSAAPSVTAQPVSESAVTPVPTGKPSVTGWVGIPKSNYNLEQYGDIHPPTESDNARYQYLLGTDEVFYTFDCPPPGYLTEAEAAKKMITITVPVWKMTESGRKFESQYDITVNKKLAANVKAIFDEIFALGMKFPIKVLKGYSYRSVGGVGLSNSTLMSMHSYGAAVDINPDDFDNDYYLGKGNDLRDKTNPYCIPDEVIEIFEKYGWFWGGNFSICSDTMHFQYLGLDYLTYQDNSPFREVKVSSEFNLKGEDIQNLQVRLKELGYNVNIDGVYGKTTESAVIKFQKKHNLPATGVVDYDTWERVINLTHYVRHVF